MSLIMFHAFRKLVLSTLPPVAALVLAALAMGLGATPAGAQGIVAVVNGDVISVSDVENRRRLFAISTGMPVTKEVLDRLTPQIIRALIDERLRLQEVQRRKIVVGDKEIAAAISDIEGRNNLPAGALRHRLESQGVEMRTLIDQIRVQLGWTQVVKEELGDKAKITDAEIAEQIALFKERQGQTEYRVGEIFIPVDDPAHDADAKRFGEAVITQLHGGAAFAVVAAEFSQSQTALTGGDLGWLEPSQLDPEIARIVAEMPPGAISNAVNVPGGYSIVTLRAKRQLGNDPATVLSVREVFFAFTSSLSPQAPTEQQRQAVEKAKGIAAKRARLRGDGRGQQDRGQPATGRPGRGAAGSRNAAATPSAAGDDPARQGDAAARLARRRHRDDGVFPRGEERGQCSRRTRSPTNCSASAPSSPRGSCNGICAAAPSSISASEPAASPCRPPSLGHASPTVIQAEALLNAPALTRERPRR